MRKEPKRNVIEKFGVYSVILGALCVSAIILIGYFEKQMRWPIGTWDDSGFALLLIFFAQCLPFFGAVFAIVNVIHRGKINKINVIGIVLCLIASILAIWFFAEL